MEEYWDDYSTYDQTVTELKQTLLDSVKKEIKGTIHSLETENKQLKERLSNLDSLEKEAQSKLHQAEQEFRTASRRALSVTAKELLLAIKEPVFMVDCSFVEKDKCSDCNDDRKLPFVYPSGKPGLERCQCASPYQKFAVTPAIGKSVDIKWWGGKREIMIWYGPHKLEDSDDSSLSGDIKEKYDGRDFSKVNRYSTLFTDEETANKYAEWLNSQIENEKG